MRSFMKVIQAGRELWKCMTCKRTSSSIVGFQHADDCKPDEVSVRFAHKPNLKGSVDRTDKGYPR